MPVLSGLQAVVGSQSQLLVGPNALNNVGKIVRDSELGQMGLLVTSLSARDQPRVHDVAVHFQRVRKNTEIDAIAPWPCTARN